MTHVCCPGCRLRFTPTVAAHLEACPSCGEPTRPGVPSHLTVGFRLFTAADLRPTPPISGSAGLAAAAPQDPT